MHEEIKTMIDAATNDLNAGKPDHSIARSLIAIATLCSDFLSKYLGLSLPSPKPKDKKQFFLSFSFIRKKNTLSVCVLIGDINKKFIKKKTLRVALPVDRRGGYGEKPFGVRDKTSVLSHNHIVSQKFFNSMVAY